MDSLTPSIGSLSGPLTGTVSFTDATGAVWSYPYSGALTATAPYTQYSVPPGDPWQLSTASSGYTLTNPLNSETLTFDNQGRYLADTDAYGNASSVTYSSGAASLPITWTAAGGFSGPNGRALSLAYNGQGLLSDVQSPLWRKSGGSQGRHVTYGYNALGQLTTLTRGAGTTDAVTTTFGYSGTQLVTVTTPAGRSWQIGYDSQGRVSSLTSPISGTLGQSGYTPAYTTTLSYTPGQTQLIVGAGSSGALTTTYSLDSSGEATAIADGLNDTQHLSYDQDHDVLTSQDADGNTTTNSYQYVGPSNNIGLITATLSPPVGIDYPWAIPNQWATTYRYDPVTYDLLETDSPGGGVTRDSYDGHHSVLTSTVLLAITSPCQAAVRRTAQLSRERSTSSGGPLGPPRPAGGVCQTYDYQWRATVNRYDADGELVSTVDGRGLDTTTDVTGTVCQGATCPDGPTDPLSYTTSYTYTPNGDLASVTSPPIVTLQNGTPTTGPVTTTSGYGTDGDLTSATSPAGATTTTSYNHLGQVTKVTQPSVSLWNGGNTSPIETTSYDPDGNVVKTVDAAGDVSVSSYDPLGRLVASTNPVSGTTVYTYSATEQTATQDPQGAVTQSNYDAAGQLSRTTDPSGAVTQDASDPAGNTTSITSTDGSGGLLSLESRQYDALNRVFTDTVSGPTTAPQTTLTSYDPDGNVAQVQQPNGDVTFDTYTLADQLETEEVDPAAVMTATAPTFLLYSYDVVGNLSLTGDLDGRVTQNSFDAANRLVQSVAITGTTLITTTPQYDPDGNMLSQTTQTQAGSGPVQTHTVTSSVNALDWTTSASDDGLVTTYGYDAAGQERTEAVLNGTQPVTTTLDAEGRASSIADGLSGTVAYSYNADDLPLTVTLPGGLLEQPQYDGASRLTTLSLSGPTTASAPLSSTYGYGYSPLDWTTALTSTLNGITSTQVLTHDADGRLTGWSSGGSTQSWQYDGNGNLTLSLSNTVPTTYTYGNGVPNELSKLQTPGQYTRKYAYDQQGDTTSITTTGAYSAALQYDSQARLVGVTFKSGQVVTMTYNAQGQRASYAVTQPGQPAWSAQFQYRGDELGQAIIISGTQTYTDTYLYDQNGSPLELLRQQGGTTNRYWYVLDGRGNVVALTDSTGNVVDKYAYDAWGAPTTSSETVPQRLRYAGYWYDAELGWYWVSVRSYDPVLKRWLQPDPSQQDGVRTFVYVGDDPVDASDPSGLCLVAIYWQHTSHTPSLSIGSLVNGAADLVAWHVFIQTSECHGSTCTPSALFEGNGDNHMQLGSWHLNANGTWSPYNYRLDRPRNPLANPYHVHGIASSSQNADANAYGHGIVLVDDGKPCGPYNAVLQQQADAIMARHLTYTIPPGPTGQTQDCESYAYTMLLHASMVHSPSGYDFAKLAPPRTPPVGAIPSWVPGLGSTSTGTLGWGQDLLSTQASQSWLD